MKPNCQKSGPCASQLPKCSVNLNHPQAVRATSWQIPQTRQMHRISRKAVKTPSSLRSWSGSKTPSYLQPTMKHASVA